MSKEAAHAKPRVWPIVVAAAGIWVLRQGQAFLILTAAYPFLRWWLKEPYLSPREALALAADSPHVLLGALLLNAITLFAISYFGVPASEDRERRLKSRSIDLFRRENLAAIAALVCLSQFAEDLLGFSGLPGGQHHVANAITGAPADEVLPLFFAMGTVMAWAVEQFYRGFVQTRLTDRWGKLFGVVASAALFACLGTHLRGILVLFVTGLLFGWVAERTDSTGPSMMSSLLSTALFFGVCRVFPAYVTAPTPLPITFTFGLVGLVALVLFVGWTPAAAETRAEVRTAGG